MICSSLCYIIFLPDIVGRYTVTIDGRSYDTVCVMDIETYHCGVVSEQFPDQNGRTILRRRANRDGCNTCIGIRVRL